MRTDFFTIYWREMIRFVRFRTLLFSSLIQPALWLAFFGIAMSSNLDRLAGFSGSIPSAGVPVGYLTFMAAGVIAMTTLFTSLFGGMSLLFDKNWGLMREIMASPLPRNQVIIGMGLSGMTKSFIQAGVIIIFGILIGVKFFTGYTKIQTIIAILGVMLFIGIFSLGFLFLSSAISISMESPEGMQGIMTLLTMPIFFASNALYPTTAFPEVLRVVSGINPLTHLVNGIRYFAIGADFTATGVHYTYTTTDIIASLLVLGIFTCITFSIALWRFRRAVVT